MPFLEILRTWEMVLSIVYFTRVKEVAGVTEKIARHFNRSNVF